MVRIALAVLALAAAVPAHADGISFQTPSGNIGCEYQPDVDDRLYCVRLKPTMQYIEFYPNGAYTGDYEGDDWFPEGAAVLGYGSTLQMGGYTCYSEESGLTCERGDHGFTANRKGVKVY